MKIEYYIETTLLKFLKTKNIDNIRVVDLIDDIGICKGTFYKYYQDKYHLMIRSFQNYYYNDIIRGADSWESFTDRCLGSFKNSPSVILNAFDSQDINSLRGYHENLMAGYFSDFKIHDEKGYLNCSIEIFTHNVTDIIINWLKGKCAESNKELIKRMKAIMPVTLHNVICERGEKNESKRRHVT